MQTMGRPWASWDPRTTRMVGRSLLIAFAVILVALVFLVVGPSIPNGFNFDGRAYWGFPRDPIYAGPGTANGYGIYRYSPIFVPIMTAFTLLSWQLFAVAWVAFLFAVYVWMVGPDWLVLLAFPPVIFEIYMGNVHLLLAAAIVLGFRYPAAWSFVLLTKVTPGIGLLWFAVRREWRSLAIATGVTAAIAAVGFVLAPGRVAGLAAFAGRHGAIGRPERVGHPAGPAAGRRRRAHRLGRPHQPALDGRGRLDAGAAYLVDAQPVDAGRRRGAPPRPARPRRLLYLLDPRVPAGAVPPAADPDPA